MAATPALPGNVTELEHTTTQPAPFSPGVTAPTTPVAPAGVQTADGGNDNGNVTASAVGDNSVDAELGVVTFVAVAGVPC